MYILYLFTWQVYLLDCKTGVHICIHCRPVYIFVYRIGVHICLQDRCTYRTVLVYRRGVHICKYRTGVHICLCLQDRCISLVAQMLASRHCSMLYYRPTFVELPQEMWFVEQPPQSGQVLDNIRSTPNWISCFKGGSTDAKVKCLQLMMPKLTEGKLPKIFLNDFF